MVNNKPFIFLLILSISLINSKITENEEQCQKIKCGETSSNDTCIQVDSIISTFQECPENQICDIVSDDPIINAKCIPKKINNFKRLPSLPCSSNDDCLSGICNQGKCQGKKQNEDCVSASDCEYGLTCLLTGDGYKCLSPLKEGSDCEMDTDCVSDSGCLNKKCTKYFSLENNEYSRDYDVEDFNFCKSGYSNDIGKCLNLILDPDFTECTESNTCEYFSDEAKTPEKKVIIESNCLCGYNPEGKKYCKIGSGNWNYTKYIQKLKDYHFNNENCHLSERTAEGCQKDLLSQDDTIIRQINELIIAKYWAKANNKLINIPECVYSIELPDYNRSLDNRTEPEPTEEGSCAKYTCDDEKSTIFCANSKYSDKYNINVLLADVCPSGVSCKIGGDPNKVFYNQSDIEAKCYSIENNKRYPGEKCELDSECVYPLNNTSSQFHQCIDGRCNGMENNQLCEDNTWCVAGYYCNKFSGKCNEQLGEGEKCLETKECQNNLICLNSKCSDNLFGLGDGKKVPSIENEEFKKKFCKNGEVIDDTCVSLSDAEKKGNDEKYKKCNFGTHCIYNVTGLEEGRLKFVDCPCGFNDVGQGYCPHYHDYDKNDWNKYRDLLIDSYDNECHTENRYHCYDGKKTEEINNLKNKLERGHLFYNSVKCAPKVLKGSYLNNKRNWYLILLSALFALIE